MLQDLAINTDFMEFVRADPADFLDRGNGTRKLRSLR
jgi:hypothetical protein